LNVNVDVDGKLIQLVKFATIIIMVVEEAKIPHST